MFDSCGLNDGTNAKECAVKKCLERLASTNCSCRGANCLNNSLALVMGLATTFLAGLFNGLKIFSFLDWPREVTQLLRVCESSLMTDSYRNYTLSCAAYNITLHSSLWGAVSLRCTNANATHHNPPQCSFVVWKRHIENQIYLSLHWPCVDLCRSMQLKIGDKCARALKVF